MSAAAILVSASVACGATNARFEGTLAENIAGRSFSASVLGTYRDGRLSADAWASLKPHLQPELRVVNCEAGLHRTLESENPEVFRAIEAQVSADSVGEELVGMIAPAAEGDVIVAFYIDGESAPTAAEPGSARPVLIAHGGAPMASDAPAPVMRRAKEGLEISAVLYSQRSARTLAAMTMYSSDMNLKEATEVFGRELGSALPRLTCAGWRWRSVAVLRETDAAGLPLKRFRLEPLAP